MPRAAWKREGRTIRYMCPQCGCEHVVNVGGSATPKWNFNGDFEMPTLTPSVNFVGRCHHTITDGRMYFDADAANHMHGSVDLPEIDV
jgi:hypothetical protein